MAINVIIGDVIEALSTLPDDSFDTVVTSPPYWGLRDYGVPGQLGLEPTLGEHIGAMVRVCEEIRRVLKPEGTFWLNYGDCYATKPNGRSAAAAKDAGGDDRTFRDKPFSTVGAIYENGPPSTSTRGTNSHGANGINPPGGRVVSGGYMKPKDLCMIPNRVAIALQEAGWWVRSEIIWAKPNPMPESAKDRPSGAHEKIFMLTKSARYYYNQADVRVPASKTGTVAHLTPGANSRMNVRRTPNENAKGFRCGSYVGGSAGPRESAGNVAGTGDRNLRNWEPAPMQVWEIATRAFKDAHFATFPPELVERCLTAGCPPGGSVLDPFGGAGTTALVADQMQRDATIIELNANYAHMAWNRIKADRGPLGHVDDMQVAML